MEFRLLAASGRRFTASRRNYKRGIMSDDLRYPIGEFERNFEVTPELRRQRINVIAELPSRVAAAVAGLNDAQLDTPYRPAGWTVRQTVHHIPDSHMNAYSRIKLALTEDEEVTIKPYYEDRWAELGDSRLPIDASLSILTGLHARWVGLFASMSDDDFAKQYIHPETGKWTLDGALALYAWHSLHHTAHITSLCERERW